MHRPPAVPPNTGGKAMDGGDGHGHGHGDVDGEPSGWSFLAARAEGDGNSFEAQWLRQSPVRWWANKWIGPSGLHPSIAAAARVVQCPTVQWCTWCVCEVEIQPASHPTAPHPVVPAVSASRRTQVGRVSLSAPLRFLSSSVAPVGQKTASGKQAGACRSLLAQPPLPASQQTPRGFSS